MKKNVISDNKLTIHVPKEEYKKCMRNILNYMEYDEVLFFYIFFGYEEYNININNYKKIYPSLNEDKGFININQYDVQNTDIVSDILNEFQIASFYINQTPNLDEQLNFDSMRNSQSTFGGYVIQHLEFDYITVFKGMDLPDWDLYEMGVSEEAVVKQESSQKKRCYWGRLWDKIN